MGVAALGCFNEFVNDVLGRGLVGITHAKVNNILAPCAGRLL